MLSAGIKDLKNNLSRYLSLVKQGEEILITERGRIIARIVRERSKEIPITEALKPLVGKGLVALPGQTLNKDIPDPIEVPGKPISEMALEDRR